MTDNIKKFMEAVSKDEAMKAEIEALMKANAQKNEKAFCDFAASKGFKITADDLKPEDGELSMDELNAVAGGSCTGLGCGAEAAAECYGVFAAFFSC